MVDKICIACGELKKHYAKGKCLKCYYREYYRNNPEYREKMLEYKREYCRERYRNDPEYREKQLKYQRRWRAVRLERTKFLLENPSELEKLRKKIMEKEGGLNR